MAVTKKGNRWELNHSLWILLSFTFLMDGIGLILAGNKTRVKKWRNAGIFYTLVPWLIMIVGTETTGVISQALSVIFVLLYVICIIHSFAIREEYLIRLELLEDQKVEQRMANKIRNQAAREYGINTNTVNVDCAGIQENSTPIYEKKDFINNEHLDKNKQRSNNENVGNQVDYTMNMNQTAPVLMDINTCTQEDLLRLPGIGIIEAKKAIDYRNNNEFNSVEEFIGILNIKPHFARKIKPMLFCNKVQNSIKNISKIINQENDNASHMGRMVDF